MSGGTRLAKYPTLCQQVARLVQTLDRKRTADPDLGAVDTRIQPAAKAVLSLARKLPPKGTSVLEACSRQDKLRPASYPCIHGSHAAWFHSLPVLLTAWVARGSLSIHDLQLF